MRKAQTGVTLISTLVGLLLGLFAALSIMSIFKTQAKAVIQHRTTSALDGQVATALLVTELEMQRAGWGVEAAAGSSCLNAAAGPSGTANTDFVVVAGVTADNDFSAVNWADGTAQAIGASGTAAVNGNAVFWRWVNDANVSTCSGLLSISGGLYQLTDKACGDATDWDGTWSLDNLTPLVHRNTLNADQAVSFAVRRTTCTPYGRMTAGNGVQVTVSAGQSTNDLSSSVTSCIPNICQ